jgi:hypothetical protein
MLPGFGVGPCRTPLTRRRHETLLLCPCFENDDAFELVRLFFRRFVHLCWFQVAKYFDFLPAAFIEHGLPLELYVDCHSFFFPQRPEALTQLGAALHFYGISLRYARTPQAKGKIERQHQYWQGRLPALFAAENITAPEAANELLPALRHHRNAKEIHRELGRTPDAAANKARREDRTVLRPVPRCPWWPYIWSTRTTLKVGPDGRVPVGCERLRAGVAAGTRVIHCLHPNGTVTIRAHEPKSTQKPAVLLQVQAR